MRLWTGILVGLVLPLPADARELAIHVNLPAYRLDVYRGEERLRSFPIAIGEPRFETPRGRYEIRHIEWTPWWTPPSSPWARGAKRTPPGPSNPMGRAKLDFLPLFYVHGSSAPLQRAVSHGCIRMANGDVLELARLLVAETGAPIAASEVAALERNPGRTRRIALPSPVAVHIVYRLVEERDGEVLEHEDVYRVGMSAPERALLERADGSTSRSRGRRR